MDSQYLHIGKYNQKYVPFDRKYLGGEDVNVRRNNEMYGRDVLDVKMRRNMGRCAAKT